MFPPLFAILIFGVFLLMIAGIATYTLYRVQTVPVDHEDVTQRRWVESKSIYPTRTYQCTLQQQSHDGTWTIPEHQSRWRLPDAIHLIEDMYFTIHQDCHASIHLRLNYRQLMSGDFELFMKWAKNKRASFPITLSYDDERLIPFLHEDRYHYRRQQLQQFSKENQAQQVQTVA